MEVYKNLPEGTLAELIENVIYMSPSPVSRHQRTLNEVNFELLKLAEETSFGEVFVAPLDVYFDERSNAVQPDIIVILTDNLGIVQADGHIHGCPDLLVEILSEGNREHDLVKKKALYERFGVKEYWIIDPETRLSLCYSLVNARFELIGEDFGVIRSKVLNVEISF